MSSIAPGHGRPVFHASLGIILLLALAMLLASGGAAAAGVSDSHSRLAFLFHSALRISDPRERTAVGVMLAGGLAGVLFSVALEVIALRRRLKSR